MIDNKRTSARKWLAGIASGVAVVLLVYWVTVKFLWSPSCEISGIWKVVQNSQTRSEPFPSQTSEHWEIKFDGRKLSIWVIQDFHMPRMYWSKKQLTVSNVKVSGCKFSFVTYVSDSVQKTTTTYNLTFTGQEVAEGMFQATDRGAPELPNLVMTGTVRMVKEPEPQI